jgi:hypothetical protein
MILAPLLFALTLLGVPMPKGSRAPSSDEPTRVVSGKSYRDTVDFMTKWLSKSGAAHTQIGPYRARGVDVTRFVSDDATSKWLAIHVYRQAGKTWIFVVQRER